MKSRASCYNYCLKNIFTKNVWKQLWLLIFFFTCFYSSASYSIELKSLELSALQRIIVFVLIGLTLLSGIFLYWMDMKKIFLSKSSLFKKNIPILVLLLISLIMRIPMLNTLPRWDAGEYYYTLGTACQNFDFSFDSFWNFRIAGHPTLGFAFFTAIGEFLNPRGVTGVLIINLIGTLFAIYCIYQLFMKWIPNSSKMRAAFLAFIVSVTPLFYGTFSYVNVDYYMVIFFTIMVYMTVTHRYILMTFFAICTSQTKEPGIILLAGYFLVHFIRSLCYGHSFKERMSNMLRDGINWCALCTGATYLLYLIRQGALFVWGNNDGIIVKKTVEFTAAGKFNSFGFIPEYIQFKIKQFFFSNFAWINTLLLIISIVTIIIYFYKHSEAKKIIHLLDCLEILGAMIAFILFGLLYVTGTLSRYNIVVAVFLTFLALLLFENTLGEKLAKKTKIIGGGLLAALLIFQTFASIDNVSNYMFKTVNTGSSKMLWIDYDAAYFGDGLVNSYQYTWINRAMNKMLKDIEYDKDTLIIEYKGMGAGSHIAGNGNVYVTNWNTKTKQRTCIETTQKFSEIIPINHIGYSRLSANEQPISLIYEEKYQEVLPQKAVLYFIPYYEENAENALLELADTYTVVSKNEANVIGGIITYYMLIKK